MKKADILKRYELNKIDDITVFIQNKHFSFAYTKADAILKPELKGQYRYVGGLQSEYHDESPAYKQLENWLCEIAEKALS